MTGMLRACRSFLGRYWRDRTGVAGYFMAISVVALVGMTGYALDFGHVLLVQRQLQQATDAAALAGATQIVAGETAENNSLATNKATSYSAVSGDQNAGFVSVNSVTMVTDALACFNVVSYPKCTPGSTPTATPKSGVYTYNGIIVTQQAVVKTWFLKLVGVPNMTVTATSTASASGGPGTPLNVMILLDTTASMATTDNSCGTNVTQETCALQGLQELLGGLNQSIDYVGIMVFPGLISTTQASEDTSCGGKSESPTSQYYNNIPASETNSTSTYLVATLQNTYQDSSSNSALNTNSALVNALGNGSSDPGCLPAKPPGGQQTYYAGVITAAQAALVALSSTQTPPAQNVIVLLSDGGANSGHAQTNFDGYVGSLNTTTGAITASTALTVIVCPDGGGSGCAASTTTSESAPLAVGDEITGTGIAAGATIVAQTAGAAGCHPISNTCVGGSTGSYTLSSSAAVGNVTSQTNGTGKNKTTTYSWSTTQPAMVAATLESLDGTSVAQNTDQCQQAVLAARAAAATGTWVYAVAYGASDSASSSSVGCTTDGTSLGISGLSAWLSTCQTMQYIANSKGTTPDASKFYSDGIGSAACTKAGTTGALETLFQDLSVSLTQARIIPNGST